MMEEDLLGASMAGNRVPKGGGFCTAFWKEKRQRENTQTLEKGGGL